MTIFDYIGIGCVSVTIVGLGVLLEIVVFQAYKKAKEEVE